MGNLYRLHRIAETLKMAALTHRECRSLRHRINHESVKNTPRVGRVNHSAAVVMTGESCSGITACTDEGRLRNLLNVLGTKAPNAIYMM